MDINLDILLPVLLLMFGFMLYCFITIIKHPVKRLPKIVWALLCLNVLGCIAFLIWGRDDE